MREYSKGDLIDALKKIGLKKGDTVLVTTELFALGRMKGASSRERYSESILEAIFEAIGKDEGTVAVNAFTTYTARYGIPFDYDRSRPITGAFSEYVLFHRDSVRSLHPINSVAAIGRMKKEICLDVSASNYGLDSPYDRMHKLGCQILRLGYTDYANSAFLHYVESLYGVPYLYNKLLDIDVIMDGGKVARPFFASVRHLEIDLPYNLAPFKKILLKKGCVHSAGLGQGEIHRISSREYCAALLALFKKDPYAIFERPLGFKKGQKPYDGLTQGRDGTEKQANYLFKDIYGQKAK